MGVADRRFLQSAVKPGMTVVDIGANQGIYALLFANLVGAQGRVLAFEPDDLLHDALVENVRANQANHVTAHHLALGSQPCHMTLYRSLLNSGDNRLASRHASGGPREAVQVRVARLDDVLAGERIDFIKMDVQGWEMEALRGMQGLLDAAVNAEIGIYFEYFPQGLRDAGSEPLEMLAFLRNNGFTLHSFPGGKAATPVVDLEGFARSLPAKAYVNLYAVRGS